MFNNKKLVLLAVTLIALTITLSAISATEDVDAADTQSLETTVTQGTTTSVTEKQIVNENNKIITKNNKNIDKKESSNIILNSTNFNDYVTDGKFNEKVSDGDTIDIQGKLDSPKFDLNVNKAVNIISSTGDAYIDLDTRSLGTNGEYTNGMFQISEGSAGTNITGITFHNTRVWVFNTFDVHIDNITVLCEQNTGSGVGSFSIRANSHDVTVTNSYFKTIHNGGHSNVVVAGASNCLFENNTVFTDAREGNVGNVFYLTTYGGSTNTNITIRNNTIRSIFPNNQGLAICMGLVLEGKGHLIENNHIDALRAVGPQWADSSYGVVTYLDNITFRNNHVTGGAILNFNGLFYNNTIDVATFGNNKAYNNTIENVNIYNNTIFENNTANEITIYGTNNTLNNNVIYSDEDYAVTINDENNTLTNNKLLSNLGYGEDAISNSTEYVSVNNSEKMPRIFYITDENIGEYFDDMSIGYPDGMKMYKFKADVIDDGDILIFNLTPKYLSFSGNKNMVIKDTLFDNIMFDDQVKGNLTIINSIVPGIFTGNPRDTHTLTLINSTIYSYSRYKDVIGEDYVLLSDYPINKTYILSNYLGMNTGPINTGRNSFTIFDKSGHILSTIDDKSKVILHSFEDSDKTLYTMFGVSSSYLEEVYIDKSLDFVTIKDINRGHISSNVHLISGSELSTFEGVTFDGDVLFETGTFDFINCTFNKDITINDTNIHFDGCTFNAKVTLNSSINSLFNNCLFNSSDVINVFNTRNLVFENNTVTTSAVNTIVFDDESNSNVVKNNYLLANSFVGDDSVVIGDNIVEDNIPGYDTQIIIDCDSPALLDEIFEVTITVNDLNNSKPVSKGYVEVYYDGYLVDIKDLTYGVTSVEIPVAEYVDGSDSYPIKVWYYEGKQYNNNITTKNINVVKSNVTIILDEFTAKLNEKATVIATFINSKGNPVKDTNVTFTVGSNSYVSETSNGLATINELITKEWLDAVRISIAFPSSDDYNSNSSTFTLNTSKADILITPKVTVEGSTASINLALTDELNNNITDGKVTITTMDGTQLASGRVNNGVYTATVTIPENYESEYLVANYTGSYYYNDMARNIKLSLMLNSTITIQTNSPVYCEELVINGKLEDSKGNAIGNTNVTLSLNGTKAVVTTDSNGDYTYTYIPELGVNTITATFNGNEDAYGCSVTKNITIRDTTHEINDLLNQIEELTAENEVLTDELANASNIIAEQNATINDLNNTVQQQSAVIEELGEVIEELTAKKSTRITLENITDAKYGDTITISGKLVDEKGYGVPGTIKLLINNGRATVKTNANGVFSYDYKVTKVDSYVVQASFLETDAYNPCNATMSFDVAQQDTIIIFDEISEAKIGNNVTVTGKLVDANGNAIVGNIKLLINSGRATVKTDSNGVFTYTFTAGKIGTNNITATYLGNTKYLETSAVTTVEVITKDTQIIFDDIASVKKGEKVTISGKLLDEDGNAIVGTIKLLINGGRATVKTDADGVFIYEYTANKVGTLEISASYLGATRYAACNATTSVEVAKLGTKITFKGIGTVTQKTLATISGYLKDENGKAITGTVKLLINNGKATVKTDGEGLFTYSYNATRAGVNTVTATYLESANYLESEASTSFTVVKP